MAYFEFKTNGLDRGIHCLWCSDASGSLVVPDGAADLILTYTPQGLKDSYVIGPNTKPFRSQARTSTKFFGIRFSPGQASRFLDFPLSELTEKRVNPSDLPGDEWERAVQEIAAVIERGDFCNEFSQKTVRGLILQLEKKKPSKAHKMFDHVWSSPERYSSSQMADELGYSRQHLRRIFLAGTGLNPKEFLKIARFHRVYRALNKANDPVSTQQLVYDNGYCDQAHMIHEVRRYSGQTPGQLMAT